MLWPRKKNFTFAINIVNWMSPGKEKYIEDIVECNTKWMIAGDNRIYSFE